MGRLHDRRETAAVGADGEGLGFSWKARGDSLPPTPQTDCGDLAQCKVGPKQERFPPRDNGIGEIPAVDRPKSPAVDQQQPALVFSRRVLRDEDGGAATR